jgi:hypothetical protein
MQPSTLTFLDRLAAAIVAAGTQYPADVVAPAAILWPDDDRQWVALLPALRERLPIYTLGSYCPEERRGPAYWLRCAVAGALAGVPAPEGVPIVYLPGVSRRSLRAIDKLGALLLPLAELQYRGVLWTQTNGRDWTIAAFLGSANGGLGIDVGDCPATRRALCRALPALAAQPVAALEQAAPIRETYLHGLLVPDLPHSLLLWLDDPQGYRKAASAEVWEAFCSLAAQEYGLQPESDGPIEGARRLGGRAGKWEGVWERFRQAPAHYPGVPEQLRAAAPMMLAGLGPAPSGAWPQDNERAEESLRQNLLALQGARAEQARGIVQDLETEHAVRRGWVWADLDRSPLAMALEHLAAVAASSEMPLNGATVSDITEAYAERGWKVDGEALLAAAAVEVPQDDEAVQTALRALYRPWLEDAAAAFQAAAATGYVAGERVSAAPGTCILFCDALRLDLAQRLQGILAGKGAECVLATRLAALPTVTGTAKPAASPVAVAFSGEAAPELTPRTKEGNAPLTAEKQRAALIAAGFQVLAPDETGDPAALGWTEMGALDSYGHQHGWVLARQAAGELQALANRVEALLGSGWAQVVVITDHGWLLVPDGLPKVSLPEHLTVVRKGRCARLKEGAHVDLLTMPWHWDATTRIAMAPGIGAFEAGQKYEHGGLSPQECVTPVLTVRRAVGMAPPVSIESVKWTGLRCTVELTGATAGLTVDVRSKAADAGSSLAGAPKAPDETGRASLLVEDDDAEGAAAFVVVTGADGGIAAQALTTVGE